MKKLLQENLVSILFFCIFAVAMLFYAWQMQWIQSAGCLLLSISNAIPLWLAWQQREANPTWTALMNGSGIIGMVLVIIGWLGIL
jgi:F0F1-type ATP synthase assembly protein I